MPRRTVIAVVALGVAGLIAAAGIGVIVNEVSGESIGLAADPLQAGEPLAPAAARRETNRKPGEKHKKPDRPKNDEGETTTPAISTTAAAAPPPTTTFEDVDDDSGSDDSGSGSDDSGSDSDNSGPGSDSSGHGSGSDDDEPEFEDD